MDHLDNVNDEVALHVLGLLKHLTYNANQHAQNEIWECISSRESVFCERVYTLLENVIAVFEVSRWDCVEINYGFQDVLMFLLLCLV